MRSVARALMIADKLDYFVPLNRLAVEALRRVDYMQAKVLGLRRHRQEVG